MAKQNPYQVRKWTHRFQMLYLWLVRTVLFFLPNSNFFMRIRGSLYRPVFKSCGPGFKVANDVVINAPQKIELGSNVYFAVGCVISGGGEIKIGDNVLFGPKNLVIANNHAFNGIHYRELIELGETVIEDNCWVGAHCCLLMGCRLKKGSLLAAGSILSRPHENEHMLVAGNPAKEIKPVKAHVSA